MPVTLEFPDGTKITGEVEEILRLLKQMTSIMPKIFTDLPSEKKDKRKLFK